MRAVWVALVIGALATTGCISKPKREMRQNPKQEELVGPPDGTYLTPREADRDQPILQPKTNTPGLNTGMQTPGASPSGPGMSPGSTRR
ncbi:MAG TPA: hypothetical protein VHR66_04920 [Gemmataceae bacterium]|jgi:hypothetical protein|nr:hypothetical protein [Gemmataceae bacterium]